DEDQRRDLVLQASELHQRAEVVAQVQVAGGLDAGKHASGAGEGGRSLVGHGRLLEVSGQAGSRPDCGRVSGSAPSPGAGSVSHAAAIAPRATYGKSAAGAGSPLRRRKAARASAGVTPP